MQCLATRKGATANERPSIGGFYAFVLSRNPNVRLTVVARSNYAAVSEHGIVMNSENHGEHTVRPYKGKQAAPGLPRHQLTRTSCQVGRGGWKEV